jgi:putative flavoprotein involved in K+ transport
VSRIHTVVIGAGQAGLATGHFLAQRGVDFAIVDGAARVGDSWRKRWDSLRLFTPAQFDSLPGMPIPAPRKGYLPSKDEVADYLEAYVAHFSLPVRLGTRVERLTREGERYVVTTGKGRLEADNVVVATGPFQVPYTPPCAAELDRSIVQLHSSAYKNPGQLPAGDALVVGAGTSGCEIAMELARTGTRKVYLAGRGVGSIAGVKAFIARPLIPWVFSRQRDHFLGKKLFGKARSSGGPLVGFGYKDVARAGVERVGRVTGVRDGKPELEGGATPGATPATIDVASVVWSTGFRVDFSWIDLPIFGEDGYPRHQRGVVEGESGLYFVGLIFLHSLSSQLIMGVQRDSQHVAEQLMARSEGRVGQTGKAGKAGIAVAESA